MNKVPFSSRTRSVLHSRLDPVPRTSLKIDCDRTCGFTGRVPMLVYPASLLASHDLRLVWSAGIDFEISSRRFVVVGELA